MNEFRLFLAAITTNQRRYAFWLLRKWLRGLTHRRCQECRAVKGLTLHGLCERCQFRNVEVGLTCDTCGCSPFRDCEGCGCECHAMEEVDA